MRRLTTLAVVSTATMWLFGCGGASSSASNDVAMAPMEPLAERAGADVIAESGRDEASVDTSTLPPSPWSDERLGSNEVPPPILLAWSRADNREICAPIAPRDLGAGAGARARVSDFEGGWAVEFDRRGAPGISRNGQTCTRCGRGMFGIAGTNLTPEDLVGEESNADVPEPSFADGSHLQLEPPAEGELVAAATLTVRGQSCVYQVWSFLGEEHVNQLVRELRLVDVEARPAHIAAR
jgi:hypothetical protein